ncbi:unnamed protein product [Periconia digitata]|uniref:Uncharacterized protein n=1 Tax=Periconia digitata TaxID=1303443 RepID=A0A9W4UGI0_9PLEO|nr:unnamed protein product [Periconia digitata]
MGPPSHGLRSTCFKLFPDIVRAFEILLQLFIQICFPLTFQPAGPVSEPQLTTAGLRPVLKHCSHPSQTCSHSSLEIAAYARSYRPSRGPSSPPLLDRFVPTDLSLSRPKSARSSPGHFFLWFFIFFAALSFFVSTPGPETNQPLAFCVPRASKLLLLLYILYPGRNHT